ncbi:hypothetical protein H8A95_01310 [Bradyrhizobium sp. Pear76]|uniref:hypothetical protein n=1 Tax=Bradyrhizobium oropedii TaxID=1571201 RepID=UPI001E60D4B3|nr:hypothetical protein [Bradyrhizobium oropedii]MCC8960980.1 hypothetical protein [Bradyrhizobium oropedii]
MPKYNWSVSLAILLFASTSLSAQSEERCSVGALKGSYIFVGRGFIEAIEPTIQRVHYGIFVFDGAGKLSGKQSSSRGGKIGREKLEGTYTLDADCTGTLALATVGYGKPGFETHWDLYVAEDHKRGHIVRMDEGNMAVRSFEK